MERIKVHVECDSSNFNCCTSFAVMCNYRLVRHMIFLYMACSAAYIFLGILTKVQPFSQNKEFDDASSAQLMCFLPAIISLIASVLTKRIYRRRERLANVDFVLAAIITLILCIYTAVVARYAWFNADRYSWQSNLRANQISGDIYCQCY